MLVTGLIAASHAMQLPAQRPRLTRELRIGSIEEEATALSPVGGALVRPDGSIYVLQTQEGLIKVFDSKGRRTATIGRRGAGPGEFTSPVIMGLKADTLWVIDNALDRVSLFDAANRFITSMKLTDARFGRLRVAPVWLLKDGTILSTVHRSSDPREAGTTNPILRTTREGDVLNTIVTLSHDHATLEFRNRDRPGNGYFAGQPFNDSPLYNVTRDGGGILVTERRAATRADQAFVQIRVLSLAGDTLSTVRVRYVPRPLAANIADSLMNRWNEKITAANVYANPREARQMVRQLLFLPKYLPPVSAVIQAVDGSFWLRRSDRPDKKVEYMIVDKSGVLRGTLENGPDHIFHIDGNRVWGIELGEFDVPYIARYVVTGI